MRVGLLWLINEGGEVLIARRADGMDSDAGMWGLSVTGAIEPDETDQEGLLRETREELGIDTVGLSPIHLHDETYLHKDGRVREFSFFYARTSADIVDGVHLDPAEVAEVRWISVPDLKKLYQDHPEQIIISDATQLWRNIFANLDTVVS